MLLRQHQIPQNSAAIRFLGGSTEHDQAFLRTPGVALHVRHEVGPARARHLPEYGQSLPGLRIDVEEADVVQSHIRCLLIDVIVATTVDYQQVVAILSHQM